MTMKILQLVTKRQYRGAEVFAANLSSELIGFGHQIIFAGLYKNDSDILAVEGAKNIDLVEKKSGVLSVNLVQALIKLIKTQQPDVVQCNGSDTLKYMVAASLFTKNVPITYRNISTISEWIDSPLKLYIYKNLFKRVAFVTSVGSESIQDLIKTLNYPKKQTSVIRRGIPIKTVSSQLSEKNLIKELNLDNSNRIVMHIGNFSPEKNHIFLLDIFDEIKKEYPEVKLVCVGNGVTFQTIKEQIEKRGLEDTVFLLGFRKDIPELLSQAHCFALCSKIEGVPGVILEAASQKVPSVATKVGGVPEVLINDKTGFIVDNFNKCEFKERLISLVKNIELNRQMGENAFKLIKNEFNPVRNAKKFENLYSFLIGKPLSGNKKLRILQIIQKKQFRGAEVFASQLSTHLLNHGHSVQMISVYDGKAELPFSQDISTLDRRKIFRGFDFYGWKKLATFVRETRPDIIQANASDTLKYAVLSKLLFRWKTPIIFRNASTSSFYITNSLSKSFNSFLLKHVDLVISVSQASLNDLSVLFPFVKFKSKVIPIGVEDKFVNKRQEIGKSNAKNILHIGSFTREKNHEGLIKIFKYLIEKNFDLNLHLVGSGPLLDNIKLQVKELNLSSRVNFHAEKNDPRDFFQMSDILVLPSLVEGLPGVVLEAMANKVPVIAYNVGGISEILTKETGFIIPFGEEKEFADKLIESLNFPNNDLLDKAQALVRSKYLNELIAQQFESEYYKLVDSRPFDN